MYLCMYVFIYVYLYVRIYVFMYVCIYVFMYVCMYICIYVCMYVCMHACTSSIRRDSEKIRQVSHLLRSYCTLSPSAIFMHPSQRFCQSWKHSWNAFFGVMLNSASEVSLISSPDSNRLPFSTDFSLVERKKPLKSFHQYLPGRQSPY